MTLFALTSVLLVALFALTARASSGASCSNVEMMSKTTYSGTVWIQVEMEDPNGMLNEICCSYGSRPLPNQPFTVNILGPGKSKGQTQYICTIFNPNTGNFVSANDSISAGLTPNFTPPPTPPPQDLCSTLSPSDCYTSNLCYYDIASHACLATTPANLNCTNQYVVLPSNQWSTCDWLANGAYGCPICIMQQILPTDPANLTDAQWRSLSSSASSTFPERWNWTSGAVSNISYILQMPPQIEVVGTQYWFSIGSGYTFNPTFKNWTNPGVAFEVLYNGLRTDGTATAAEWQYSFTVSSVGFDAAGPSCQNGVAGKLKFMMNSDAFACIVSLYPSETSSEKKILSQHVATKKAD